MNFRSLEASLGLLVCVLLFGLFGATPWYGRTQNYSNRYLKKISKKKLKIYEKKWYWFLYKRQYWGTNIQYSDSITYLGFYFQTISMFYYLFIILINITLNLCEKSFLATILTLIMFTIHFAVYIGLNIYLFFYNKKAEKNEFDENNGIIKKPKNKV